MWSSPRIWTVGESLTPAHVNQHLHGDMLALRNPDNRIYLHLDRDQQVRSNTFEAVAWDNWGAMYTGGPGQDGTNLNSALWATENRTRLLAPITGLWRLTATLEFSSDVLTDARGLGVRRAAWDNRFMAFQPTCPAGTTRLTGADVLYLLAGDFAEVLAFQSSTQDLAILGRIPSGDFGNFLSRCSWELIGEA